MKRPSFLEELPDRFASASGGRLEAARSAAAAYGRGAVGRTPLGVPARTLSNEAGLGAAPAGLGGAPEILDELIGLFKTGGIGAVMRQLEDAMGIYTDVMVYECEGYFDPAKPDTCKGDLGYVRDMWNRKNRAMQLRDAIAELYREWPTLGERGFREARSRLGIEPTTVSLITALVVGAGVVAAVYAIYTHAKLEEQRLAIVKRTCAADPTSPACAQGLKPKPMLDIPWGTIMLGLVGAVAVREWLKGRRAS